MSRRFPRLGLLWARGRRVVESVLLVAPFHDPARRIGDVPETLVLGTCNGDTGLTGATYLARDHFAATMLGADPVAWMSGPVPSRVYGRGRAVVAKRVVP